MERIVCEQIRCYFSMNSLTTDFQHAYREGHSAATALTQTIDDWLRDIEEKKIVSVVPRDFTAAFEIIYDELLLKKIDSTDKELLINRTQTIFFMGRCGVAQ